MEDKLIEFLLRDENLSSALNSDKNLDVYAWIASKLFGTPYERCKEFTKTGKPNISGKNKRMIAKNIVIAFFTGNLDSLDGLLKKSERKPREKLQPETNNTKQIENQDNKEEHKLKEEECKVKDDTVDPHKDVEDAVAYGLKFFTENLKKRFEERKRKEELSEELDKKIEKERERTSKAYELVQKLNKYNNIEFHDFTIPEYIVDCNPFNCQIQQLENYIAIVENAIFRQRDFDMGFNKAVRLANKTHLFKKLGERNIV